MEEKVELKVNIINQLRLLRQSTFKDVLCFLDEDIQNAQRAKATNVYITVNRNSVTIENDGAILDNPQALFSIAESGWDNETKETENPFGMGFFSNITISSLIEVFSGNKHLVFDVDNMIDTNNTEIKIEELEESYPGFKLVLNKFNFDTASSYDIGERVEQLGRYVQDLNVYYNGALQEKKDLTEGDNSYFQLKIEEDDIQGWIALGSNYWYSDNLNIFYKGRLVKKLENSPYLKGDIHVGDKTLSLTSPDRKDIIKDGKYSSFYKKIQNYAKKLCEEALLEGDEQEVEEFANAVGYYVDKQNVKNKIRFLTLKGQDEKDFKYFEKIALAKSKDKNISNYKDFRLYLEKESEVQSESHFEEIEIKEDVVTTFPDAKGIITHSGSSSYSEGYTERPEIKEKETEEKIGEIIINNEEPVFWMSFGEIETYEFKFNMLKYYGLKLIISRNKVEDQILKAMKESDKVIHISELLEDVEITGYLTMTELSIKEQRALMLLELISRILGFNHNIFAIGDLMVTKTVKIESLNVSNEIIEESITVLRNLGDKKTYIDRSIIDLTDIEESLNSEITIKDYKFILTNLDNLVEQSYLLCEGHKNKDKVMQDILLGLGQGVL